MMVVGGGLVLSFLLTTTGVVLANNQWSCWHWDKNTITRNTAASGYWGTVISTEFDHWDTGGPGDPSGGTCIEWSSGNEVTGDAGFYGTTGWLGIARILDYDAAACLIKQADALMNRTYLDGASYDEIDDRHVTCQEIGHDIGLDHVKGPRNQSCMNDQWLGWDHYNQHDADTVAAITDDPDCGGGGGTDPGCGKEKGKNKCSDGIDNDCDGLTDGADPDC